MVCTSHYINYIYVTNSIVQKILIKKIRASYTSVENFIDFHGNISFL